MSVKRTGVFATSAEIKLARRWMVEANQHERLDSRGRPEVPLDVREEAMGKIDDLAASHGLPRPPSFSGKVCHYGMLASGEFTTDLPAAWEPVGPVRRPR